MAQPAGDDRMSASLDPVTVELIGSALASITDEMCEALVRASHSTNVKERRDCTTALFDADGRSLCEAEQIPMLLGSFIDMVPQILKRYPREEIRPGDVFVGNDPYVGGSTHLPDIVLTEPIFHDGTLVAWAINTAHHADFADRGHAHIFQEGLRIPPIRLYRAGALQQDVMDLILLNCQVPRQRLADFRAQMACNRRGARRVGEMFDRYGAAIMHAAAGALQDYAERKMRAGIAALPDGIYRFSDRFDNVQLDGELDVSVEITVAGDSMILDFESPPQVRAALNMVHSALLASVYYAVKAVIDPDILPNAGLARPLVIKARPGTLLNCTAPAAVYSRHQTAQRVVDLILGALAPALPARVIAAANGACAAAHFTGTDPASGRIWIFPETIGGGSGARKTRDGLDAVHVHMTNTSNLPIEALETEYPISVLSYGLVTDSGGAGRTRGGMAISRVYRADTDCRLRIDGSRLHSRPWGLDGGLPGSAGFYRLDGQPTLLDRGMGPIRAGQVVEIISPGAGGYGPPAERSQAEVARDLAERRISQATARDIYGFPAERS
jgi:N-methylhydantoinase B